MENGQRIECHGCQDVIEGTHVRDVGFPDAPIEDGARFCCALCHVIHHYGIGPYFTRAAEHADAEAREWNARHGCSGLYEPHPSTW